VDLLTMAVCFNQGYCNCNRTFDRKLTMLHQTLYPACQLPDIGALPLSDWNPVCHITYDRASWVKLIQPPSKYSFDEAMLLCQESSNTWRAWIPDYGEVLLDRSNFYC
jgi:hypothetical protein